MDDNLDEDADKPLAGMGALRRTFMAPLKATGGMEFFINVKLVIARLSGRQPSGGGACRGLKLL